MKRFLLTLTMVLSLSAAMMAAPKNTTETDSATVNEVELFSDTTGVDSSAAAADYWEDEWDDWEDADTQTIMNGLGIDGGDIKDMVFVLCILFILFILAPVVIIGLILFFVYKNRKERIRLAETALKNGKQMPFDALGAPMPTNDALWNKGIKQLFLGVGLAFLLWVILPGKLGLAIGALIALIGGGNMVIAKQAENKQRQREFYEQMRRSDKEAE